MRLDKYLKVARILKRRTVSKEFALAGRALLNGKPAKPSSEVKVDDCLTLELGDRQMIIKILAIPDQIGKKEATSLYEVIREEIHVSPME
jgi:ribosomal 50S subunit-recycling heat shock protein